MAMPYLHDLMPLKTQKMLQNLEWPRPRNFKAPKIENPLYGHRLVKMTVVSKQAELLVLSNQTYTKYLSSRHSPFANVPEDYFKATIENGMCLQKTSSQIKAEFYSLFEMVELPKNEIILE